MVTLGGQGKSEEMTIKLKPKRLARASLCSRLKLGVRLGEES